MQGPAKCLDLTQAYEVWYNLYFLISILSIQHSGEIKEIKMWLQ